MHTIAFVTQKGGSGKSTTAASIAVAASYQGRRVFVLELDRQALTAGHNFIDNQVRVGAVSQPDGFAY